MRKEHVDGIKAATLLNLIQACRLSGRPSVITGVLKTDEGGRGSVSSASVVPRGRGRDREPLEAGRTRKQTLSTSSRRKLPCTHLDCNPVRLVSDF